MALNSRKTNSHTRTINSPDDNEVIVPDTPDQEILNDCDENQSNEDNFNSVSL